MDILKRLCQWMQRHPAAPVAVGVALALPSLWVGLQGDDLLIRATVRGEHLEGVPRRRWEPFTFLDGDPEHNRRLMQLGWMPFWMDTRCRACFLRPLAALTHMVDHHAWPQWPVLMHLQSLVWYALLIGAVAALYRRMMRRAVAAWAGGLATLLFAVDEAHGIPVGWLANRSTLLAGFFGILALLAYERWRRDGWSAGAVLAPLALAAGLLAKEETLSILAYLLGYAWFLDRGPRRRRLGALMPCFVVAATWAIVYKTLGFGVQHSGMYVDPVHDPLRYAGRVAENAPLLLLGQWGLPESDITAFWSAMLLRIHWLWALAFLALLAVVLAPLVARDRLARFWALGMLLSVVPVCAVFASDRLLMFVGIGAMGLLAQFLAGLKQAARWMPPSRAWRRLARVLSVFLIAAHLVIAPLLLPVKSVTFLFLGRALAAHLATLPSDRELERQTVVFADSAPWALDMYWHMRRREAGLRRPIRTLHLTPSGSAATVTRRDRRTLVVRPRGGYLRPWRGPTGRGDPEPAVSPVYLLRLFDLLARAPDCPMALGETVRLAAATVTITGLTPDGRPAEATFRFDVPLEDPSLRWLRLTRRGCEPFIPPRVGEAIIIPSILD